MGGATSRGWVYSLSAQVRLGKQLRLGEIKVAGLEDAASRLQVLDQGVTTMRRTQLQACLALSAVSFVPWPSVAQRPPAVAQPRQDIAEAVAGTYSGAVIADTRGGSQSGVSITVTRVAKNLVSVSSDYPRIPTVRIALTRASDAIIAARPGNGFLIELAKDPRRLDLSIDGVTWMGHKD